LKKQYSHKNYFLIIRHPSNRFKVKKPSKTHAFSESHYNAVMSQPTQTLVLAAGSLGDCVLTLPALQKLQSLSPLTVAGTSPYVQIGPALLGVEKVIPLEGLLQFVHSDQPLDPAFWGGFSDVYVFFKDSDSKLIERLRSFPDLKVHQPSETFTNFLKKERWAGEYWLHLVQPGYPHPGAMVPPSRLSLSDAVKERGALLCDFLQVRRPLIIHPGSGSPAKNAPLSFFKKAAEKTAKETEQDVLVIWGDAELDQYEEIMETFKGMDKVKVLPDLLMLRDLVAVLSQAQGYLGNDSGVTHLASACGIKTFAVFNSTDAKVWGPQEAIILAAMQTLYSSR
jgi:ADP-heptose:LPS heptosyltransferase